MYWKWAYASLMLLSSLCSYVSGIQMEKNRTEKGKLKLWFLLGLSADLSILLTFKYFNFFNANISTLASYFRLEWPFEPLSLILPLGISFYTFQSLSYTIDVYKGKAKAEKHFGYYALFVSFFPQLVAGPIEKSFKLIKQLKTDHAFKLQNIIDGFKLVLWGLFKKVVIADTLAIYIAQSFDNLENDHGLNLWIVMVFFIYQVYCDFSGYSDIAIGSAKMLGINLSLNFNLPFRASSYSELWRRWHITLTGWVREYIYIPMGGNKVSPFRSYLNIIFSFGIIGLWHGAAWTFVFFGLLHGVTIVIENLLNKYISFIKAIPKAIKVVTVFLIYAFNCIIFRCEDLSEFTLLVKNAFTPGLGQFSAQGFFILLSLILLLESIQYFQKDGDKIPFSYIPYTSLRFMIYILLTFLIMIFGNNLSEQPFFYFQF